MTARSESGEPGRSLVVLVCALFIFEASLYSTITPLLARYADEYSLGDGAAGLLSASYAIGVAPGAILGAWLAPRLGVRQTSTLALGMIAVGCAGFGAGESIVILDLTRLASGIGAGCLWAAGLTWLIGATPPARRGAMIGAALGASTVGVLAGPVLGTVAVAVGPAAMYSGLAVFAVLLVIPVLRQPAPATVPAIATISTRRAVRDRELRTGLWLLTFAASIYGVVNVVVPLRLDHLGAGGKLTGVVFLAAAATAAIAAPIVGRMVDRRGALFPAVVALTAAVPLFAVVAVPASIAALGVLTVLTTGLIASAVATPGAALISVSGERLGLGLATASAAINVCYAVGETVGGIAGSLVLDATFDAVPFWLLSGAAIVTLAAFARERRRLPDPLAPITDDRSTPISRAGSP